MEMQVAEFSRGAEILWAIVLAYIPNVFVAVAMLIGGWMLAGWLKKGVVASLSRFKNLDPTLRPFLGNVVRYAVLAVVVVAALSQFGIQTASILAVMGAAGLAIGLALQGTLSNIAAGLMLLWLRPFKAGEAIEAAAGSGTIQEIGLFTTEILTFDGLYKFVPNSALWNDNILNFSRMPTRRMQVSVGISYDDDIAKAKSVIRAVIDADPRFLKTPEPQVYLDNLGDSSLDLVVRAWAKSPDFWPARFDLLEKIKVALDEADISIPFPQRDVHLFTKNDAAPESIEEKAPAKAKATKSPAKTTGKISSKPAS